MILVFTVQENFLESHFQNNNHLKLYAAAQASILRIQCRRAELVWLGWSLMATVSNIRIYKNGHGIKYNISIIFSFMQVVLKVHL